MANPRVEDGHLKIAETLFVAIFQTNFSGMERTVIDVVMLLTYYRGLKKAEMTLEEIRLLIGNADKIRLPRVRTAFENLVASNVLTLTGDSIVGIQKDFDKWDLTGTAYKMSATKDSSVYISLKSHIAPDKMSASEVLLRYVMVLGLLKFTVTSFRIEKGRATSLLQEATNLAKNPRDGLLALRDYFDEIYADEWVGQNVRFPMAYALTRFEKWYKQIPKMPRTIWQEQEASGWRYKYNTKTKKWTRSRERIKPTDTGS